MIIVRVFIALDIGMFVQHWLSQGSLETVDSYLLYNFQFDLTE